MLALFARYLVPTGVAALAGLCVLPGHAYAQCQYEVTILQFPIDCGIGTVITAGLSLNENGAVVGRYKCPISKFDRPFLWTPQDGFTDLGLPPGVMGAIPTDINDGGVVCGTMYVSGVGYRGFVYEDGVWTELPPVVDAVGAWSSAAAISNAGVVVGRRSVRVNTSPQNAYIWSAEQGFTDLTILGDNSAATAMNGTRVVGWRAHAGQEKEGFLWEDGNVTLLGSIPGGFTSSASAVNGFGTIAGSGRIRMDGFPVGATRAFLWERGEFTMLGTLPDHALSGVGDISDLRIVVGISGNVDGNPNISDGFIWRSGLMTNLNDLVPLDPSILIQNATAIGNSGQIVANGHDPKSDVVAFLLTPIQPLGDLDRDCTVGINDLLLLLQQWGMTNSPADLNGDGTVGILDLLILLANWGS
ncbi:MAG: hypothetical protein IH830_13130 [Planctomycetes bacterium]|nr:hypothetical protein [Planctomycetota bacterium]